MFPRDFFHHCPRCGGPSPATPTGRQFACAACGFLYFFNPAVAVGAFVRRADGCLLWLQRARDPARGKLGLPGGFIDLGESAEAALAREIREEVGLAVRSAQFLCSQPNEYLYQDVTYPVLDLFFVAQVDNLETAAPLEEVERLVWLTPDETDPDQIAFSSVRAALEFLKQQGACG